MLPVAKAKPQGEYGYIITNPPYGERLGDDDAATLAIRQLGSIALYLPTWSHFIITPSKQVEHYYGKPASKKRKLFNGRIETTLYQFFAPGGLYAKERSEREGREAHSPSNDKRN